MSDESSEDICKRIIDDITNDPLAVAVLDLAAAIRELAAASRPPEVPPKPEYQCANCGSPKWHPGGMSDGYKVCSDCGAIGDEIDASGNA